MDEDHEGPSSGSTVAEGVSFQVSNGIRRIRINRPRTRNALVVEDRIALGNALSSADQDPATRVVVVSGTDGNFCSGADIGELALRRDEREVRAYASSVAQTVFRSLRTMRKPTIAEVEGSAAGAGMYLALGCDVVIASEDAMFHPSHSRIGLVPDWGALWILPRLVGLARARVILLGGRPVPATTAAAWGMIADAVPAGMLRNTVERYCADLTSGTDLSIGLTRAGLDISEDSRLEEFLEWEADAIAKTLADREHRDRVAAFLDRKR